MARSLSGVPRRALDQDGRRSRVVEGFGKKVHRRASLLLEQSERPEKKSSSIPAGPVREGRAINPAPPGARGDRKTASRVVPPGPGVAPTFLFFRGHARRKAPWPVFPPGGDAHPREPGPPAAVHHPTPTRHVAGTAESKRLGAWAGSIVRPKGQGKVRARSGPGVHSTGNGGIVTAARRVARRCNQDRDHSRPCTARLGRGCQGG